MPLPIIPLAILALTGGAWYKVRNKGKLTPERKAVFDAAMNHLRDSEKLRMLADTFQSEGLPVEANLLRKRANIRDLPPAVTKARNEAYKMGMASTNYKKVIELAMAFHAEGAIGAAESLRMHAELLMTTPVGVPVQNWDSKGGRPINPDIEAAAAMQETPTPVPPVSPTEPAPPEPDPEPTPEPKPEPAKEISP